MQKRKAEKSKSKNNAKEERPKKVTKKDDRLKEEKRKEKESGKTTAEKLGMQKSIDQIWLVEENKQPKCHNIGKAICTYRKFSQI